MCHRSYTMSDSASCSPTRRRKRVERGAEGKRGVRSGRIDDEVGATSTSYFAHTVRRILGPESLHDPRFPLCAGSWRRNASFSEESHYRKGTLEPLSRTSRNLSNDHCKQSREGFDSEKLRDKIAKDTPRNFGVQSTDFTISKREYNLE